jgi:hypothetical protein
MDIRYLPNTALYLIGETYLLKKDMHIIRDMQFAL